VRRPGGSPTPGRWGPRRGGTRGRRCPWPRPRTAERQPPPRG
jgi:hypothetical protein